MTQPFIKWAGGKRQLLPEIHKILPDKINNYYEPFLGGGALFFSLCNKNYFNKAILNDTNEDLINTYNVIKNDPYNLINKLKNIKVEYDNNPETTFYFWRELDRTKNIVQSEIDRAARFIFLNKTAYNGLYRLNSKGQFNAPWGKYENPNFCNEEIILNANSCLRNDNVCIINKDFENACNEAISADLVYFDPPYVPLNATSNFVSYTKDGFSLDEHVRLKNTIDNLSSKNVFVI